MPAYRPPTRARPPETAPAAPASAPGLRLDRAPPPEKDPEFALDTAAFPSLGGSQPRSTMDFSKAMTEKPVEEPAPVEARVPPGWVAIYKNPETKAVEFELGPESSRFDSTWEMLELMKENRRLSHMYKMLDKHRHAA